MRKLKNYKPTRFMAETSHYSKQMADFAVMFIEQLTHTKGTWAGKPFELIDWQERIIRDLFGVLKPNGYRQFNTAYIEIPKKMGKSELAAAVALLLCCGDGEERAEVYGCAADRQQATIVFDVAADMVRMCPALNRRVKILASQKRIIYEPTNSFYQVLSAEAYSKHGFNIHGVVFDELHTQPNRKLFDVMTKGSGDKKAMSGGMILKDATIFGQSGGTLLGGGEAGDEAVVGVSSLRSMIQDAVSSATLSISGDQLLINIEEMSVRSDDDIRKISQQLNTLLTAGRRAKGLV